MSPIAPIIAMILKDFLPSPLVRDVVPCYRIADLDFTGMDKVPEKVCPPKSHSVPAVISSVPCPFFTTKEDKALSSLVFNESL